MFLHFILYMTTSNAPLITDTHLYLRNALYLIVHIFFPLLNCSSSLLLFFFHSLKFTMPFPVQYFHNWPAFEALNHSPILLSFFGHYQSFFTWIAMHTVKYSDTKVLACKCKNYTVITVEKSFFYGCWLEFFRRPKSKCYVGSAQSFGHITKYHEHSINISLLFISNVHFRLGTVFQFEVVKVEKADHQLC